MALQIADELPVVDESVSQPLPSPETVSQVFHTTILGHGCVALGALGQVSQATTDVSPGDFASLAALLSEVGIPTQEIEDLPKR